MGQAINKTTLDNGIRILTKNMPYARSVSMGVWVNVGARDESPSENGLSHMIEHMIFKGTQKRTAFQIAKQFDAIGGQTNAFTSFEYTCYHARVIDAHLEIMVDILSDIFLNSVFDEREVEKERPVIFQEINMVEDNPEEYVHVLSGNSYWGDNPLGRSILGTRENVVKFNTAIIKNYFYRFYQPEHIVISAAGNISHDYFVDLVRPAFESTEPGNGFPKRTTPEGHPQVNIHYRDLEQVHICLGTKGISITDPRRYTFSLLNTILGGNMSSRLFQNIRERRGLAYSVYSYVSSYVDTGIFGAYVAVQPHKAKEVAALIIEDMNKLKNDRVDEMEVKHAKDYLIGNLLLASESVDNQMVRLAQNEINFGYHIPLQTLIDHIESVSEGDILTLAETLFQKDQLGLTALGPLKNKNAFGDMLKT
ncbi:MAG: insulinase family protein [Deltaproteobacteria bacterium]|nr:MAG: insulinase family protein [Deltaproteobacteria bacterium]